MNTLLDNLELPAENPEAAGLGFPPAIYQPLMSAVGKVPISHMGPSSNSQLEPAKLLVQCRLVGCVDEVYI